MNILEYVDFFPDGSVTDIQHHDSDMEIALSSSVIGAEELDEPVTLSKDNRIEGTLFITKIKSISVDNESFEGILEKKLDKGTIIDFELESNRVSLFVSWESSSLGLSAKEYACIEIQAESIRWENRDASDVGV